MIILTLLGANKYSEVSYNWQGRQAKSHSLIQVALDEWFPESDMLVLATEKANDAHGQMVKALVPKTEIVPIPDGKNTDEYWEIYNRIEQNIPAKADLVLDVTHGFRSLPVLALLAVSFLRAAKSVNVQHVLYGAFDAGDGKVAPVFDLAPFLTMLDWASATSRFVETGDGRRFKELLVSSKSQLLKDLGSDLERFTNAMVLNRTTEVTDSARKLLKVIQDLKQQSYTLGYQPLRLLENKLENAIEPIADEDPIRSQFAQITRYSKQQQYAQSIALAREWMISVRIWKTDGWFSENKEERQLAEEWLSTFAKVLEHKSEAEKQAEKAGDTKRQKHEEQKRLKVIPPAWLCFIQLWQRVSDQRNDYAHFGMRKQKSTTDTTLKKAKSLPGDLRNAVRPLGLELPEPL